MGVNERFTCITVIGWTWIIDGGQMTSITVAL